MDPYDYASARRPSMPSQSGVRERERLLQIFDGLARHPFEAGDFREPGLTGREYEVNHRTTCS